jgi:hypothetical protein
MAPADPLANASKIVIAYLDKRRERGLTADFKPYGDGFTLLPPDAKDLTGGKFIEFRACKAIYFVKSLSGNKDFKENKATLPAVYRHGTKVVCSFPDGERMVGTTEGFSPTRKGFFFYPGDPRSNNTEIFVVTSNADEVRLLGVEKDGSDRVFTPNAERGVFLPEARVAAVQRVLRGEPLEKVAKELFIPPGTLVEWRVKFLSGGPGALGAQTPGAPKPPGKF